MTIDITKEEKDLIIRALRSRAYEYATHSAEKDAPAEIKKMYRNLSQKYLHAAQKIGDIEK